MEEKRYDSRELLRPLVRPYVEAHFAEERGKRWMPITVAIGGFFVAPYFAAAEHAMDEYRIAKENNEKRGALKLLRDWFDAVRLMYGLYWYGLINSRESNEEWQEFVEEQVERATLHIFEGWLILLDDAARQNQDTFFFVDRETMLPVCEATKGVVGETIDNGYYGIGWNEFVEILKEVKKQIPDKILPDDIVELFTKEGVAIIIN